MASPRYTIIEVDSKNPSVVYYLDILQKACLPTTDPVEDLSGWWWLLYHNTFPVGFAHLTKSKEWRSTGILNRVAVMPNHRGKGLQKKLIKAREEKAESLGMKWLMTYTHVENVASSNSLIRNGYTLYRPAAGEDLIWLCWRKQIESKQRKTERKVAPAVGQGQDTWPLPGVHQ